MKTFIFLFLVVIGFFYYLFFYNTQIENQNHTLEDIEQSQKSTYTDEIVDYLPTTSETPPSIPEEQTFETIKNILKESANITYSPNITLNTPISSYLYTEQKREEFKQRISSAFNISYDEVDKMYKKNRLVWDWVNEFRE